MPAYAADRELGRLGSELHDSITLEAAASELGLETLKERVEEFRAAAARERRAQEDDQVLLEHAVRELKDRVANRLAAHSEDAPGRSLPRLEAVADSAGKRQMEDLLHGEVEHCVREGFEELRQGEASQADRAWSELAMDFRSRTQTRVDAVRQAASDLFEVHLPTVRIPTVAEERERFFYIFVHIEGLGSGLGRFLRPFLPRRFFKRLALDVARRRLADEFDKHAGQARWDLTQRLEQVQLRFEAAMRIEVEQAEKTILSAATSAEALLCSTMAEQEDQREHRGILDGLARANSGPCSTSTSEQPRPSARAGDPCLSTVDVTECGRADRRDPLWWTPLRYQRPFPARGRGARRPPSVHHPVASPPRASGPPSPALPSPRSPTRGRRPLAHPRHDESDRRASVAPQGVSQVRCLRR